MSHKLYIGNISYNVTEEELTDIFSTVGKVYSAKIITDPITGRSKGFGFIEMGDSHLAMEAVKKLNGHQIGGRGLKVDISQARPAQA